MLKDEITTFSPYLSLKYYKTINNNNNNGVVVIRLIISNLSFSYPLRIDFNMLFCR